MKQIFRQLQQKCCIPLTLRKLLIGVYSVWLESSGFEPKYNLFGSDHWIGYIRLLVILSVLTSSFHLIMILIYFQRLPIPRKGKPVRRPFYIISFHWKPVNFAIISIFITYILCLYICICDAIWKKEP